MTRRILFAIVTLVIAAFAASAYTSKGGVFASNPCAGYAHGACAPKTNGKCPASTQVRTATACILVRCTSGAMTGPRPVCPAKLNGVCVPRSNRDVLLDGVDQVSGMSCAEAKAVASTFMLSAAEYDAQGGNGGLYSFWFGYVKSQKFPREVRRYWTCRVPKSNATASCRAQGVRFRLWTGVHSNPQCDTTTFFDGIDSVSMDAGDWGQSGAFSCSNLQNIAGDLYVAGLDAHKHAVRHFRQDGGWTCTTDSWQNSSKGYYVVFFQCFGDPFQRTTLLQEMAFDVVQQAQAVQVACDDTLCEETSPAEGSDYGDTADYAKAGLVLQSDSTGGQGIVPAAGHYNQLALCSWVDQGSSGQGSDGQPLENYYCGYPG